MSEMVVSKLLQSFQLYVDNSGTINDVPMNALFHQGAKHKRAQKRQRIPITLLLLKYTFIKNDIQLEYTT